MSNQNDGKEIVKNNSEILFIYDAKMCNPNGDPDDENKPRMDYDRGINLVSDLRLKRYIRDYLMDYKNQIIFVRKIDKVNVNPKKSLATILNIEDKKQIEIEDTQIKKFLEVTIDVKLFGAIVPDVKFITGKSNATFVGPVQFNWGYSLNKVNGPMNSNGITSHFQTGKSSEDEESSMSKGSGAMGKDYRVDYSIIAFHGIISAKRAEHTLLNKNDINLFDESIIKAIPLEATTRSKTGQCPLVYIRIEYNCPEFFLGDLRKFVFLVNENGHEITFDESAKLRSSKEYNLDLSCLKERLKKHQESISNIYFWKNEDIKINGWDLEKEKEWKYEIEDGGKKTKKIIEIIPLHQKSN